MKDESIQNIIERAVPRKKEFSLDPEMIAQLQTISEVVLAVTAAVGAITIALVAPKLLNVIYHGRKLAKWINKDPRLQAKKITKSFYYLKSKGLIQMKKDASGWKIWLTDLGKKKVSNMEFDRLFVPKPPKWDGKWWQTAADIPTKEYRGAADALRGKLKSMGFFPLQRTLWFYPHNPTDQLQIIINRYHIGQFVTAMEISRLDKDDEQKLLAHFKKLRIL